MMIFLGKNILPGVDAIRSLENLGTLNRDDQVNESGEPINHYEKRHRGL
jgi:hypothetical protein